MKLAVLLSVNALLLHDVVNILVEAVLNDILDLCRIATFRKKSLGSMMVHLNGLPCLKESLCRHTLCEVAEKVSRPSLWSVLADEGLLSQADIAAVEEVDVATSAARTCEICKGHSLRMHRCARGRLPSRVEGSKVRSCVESFSHGSLLLLEQTHPECVAILVQKSLQRVRAINARMF